ncbi:MgtC/SapB family protein [Phaeobacter porticola]|uniref:Protein MgtC n=1 Tax=Phaeobacter porticola TaxID=1844006 RepID=A0A1L3IAG0_9RHOB|nr:MgtC/SapB family protein [Phaeobacter porticola]APG49023.1 putative membrane protein [Phaeobacter porticola]
MPEWLSGIGFEFEQGDWFLRLVLALAAGAILGIDREVRKRRIGVRTYMMVSLGSAIFTILSVEMAQDMTDAGLSADPTRVIQGLIGGLGFLGAGAIIQGDKRVGGMATAASLWLSGALGLAAGMGYGVFAIVCAILAAVLLAVSRIMEHRGADDRPDLR